MSEERSKAIEQVAESVNELAGIFKEIQVLVIDQGTILDRIDFNIELAADKVGAAVLAPGACGLPHTPGDGRRSRRPPLRSTRPIRYRRSRVPCCAFTYCSCFAARWSLCSSSKNPWEAEPPSPSCTL